MYCDISRLKACAKASVFNKLEKAGTICTQKAAVIHVCKTVNTKKCLPI